MTVLKDPAMMLFPSEFIMETTFMTDEEKGKYITVLCNMHFYGHLSAEEIEHICSGHYKSIFRNLSVDEKGLYYHIRMEYEMDKRAEYRKSRAKNASGKKKKEEVQSTFDTEDFYNAALERSDRFYAEKKKSSENIHKN